MPSETIVAVFDNPSDASAAVRELENAGVPSSSIKHYQTDERAGTSGTTGHPGGFWSWLLGEENTESYDRNLYDRTVEGGGTVVTVIVDKNDADRIVSVLEAHSPVDLDERASQYGLSREYGSASEGATPA